MNDQDQDLTQVFQPFQTENIVQDMTQHHIINDQLTIHSESIILLLSTLQIRSILCFTMTNETNISQHYSVQMSCPFSSM